jgi:hypothetical protein
MHWNSRIDIRRLRPFMKRPWGIKEKLGSESSYLSLVLHSYGLMYVKLKKLPQAEPLLVRAATMAGKQLGSDDAFAGGMLVDLAETYLLMDRYEEGKPLFDRGIRGMEKSLGPDHELVLQKLESWSSALRLFDKDDDADQIDRRVAEGRRAKKN